MRYTYGVFIRTFNGPHRVDALLRSMKTCGSIGLMKRRLVIEDLSPILSHESLVEVMAKYSDWELVSCDGWVNMQGTAQRGFEECDTDFVFLVSDDTLMTGDPFKNVIKWLENCPQDVAEITGGIAPSTYQLTTDLVKAGYFPGDKLHSELQKIFYDDPFDTWFKDFQPIQFHSNIVLPSVGGNVHGQAYCLNRKAWKEVGGYDQAWHGDDQDISYKIWLNTSRIIYSLPTDPILHCGAAAGAEAFHYKEAVSQGSSDRCIDLFGKDPVAMGRDIAKIIGERAVVWQEKMVIAFNSLGFYWRFV